MGDESKVETAVILKNPPEAKAALAEIPHQEAKPPEIPAGTVPRDLTFGDRKLILDAALAFCRDKEKGGYKNVVKKSRIEKLLHKDEVDEYFDILQDEMEQIRVEHIENMVKWAKYQNWKNAVEPRCETCKEKLKPPADDCVIKKPGKAEELSPERLRGESARFFIPKKLDDWAIAAVKEMNWNPSVADHVAELCGKLDIKDED